MWAYPPLGRLSYKWYYNRGYIFDSTIVDEKIVNLSMIS